MSSSSSAPNALRGILVLRLAALIVALAVSAWWYEAGANRGWYKSQVPTRQTDEITGIEFVTYEKRFVPGIDVLGAGLALSLGIYLISYVAPVRWSNRKAAGSALAASGLGILCYYFLVFDPTIASGEQRIYNMGLLANKQNGVILGASLFIVGSLITLSAQKTHPQQK